MGSDVYGLPSQETYLDSQKFHSDAAKISIFLLSSKHFRIFFTQRTFLSKFFRPFATSIAESTVNGVGFARSTPCYTSYQILCDASIVCANIQKVSLLFGELLKKQYFCVR